MQKNFWSVRNQDIASDQFEIPDWIHLYFGGSSAVRKLTLCGGLASSQLWHRKRPAAFYLVLRFEVLVVSSPEVGYLWIRTGRVPKNTGTPPEVQQPARPWNSTITR